MDQRTENRILEITLAEQEKERRFFFFNEDTLRDVWNNIKHTNICFIGPRERKKSTKGQKAYLITNSYKRSLTWKGNRHSYLRRKERLKWDVLKEVHRLPLWLSWQSIHLQCRKPGFDPWVGKIPSRGEWLPTPVFWTGEFLDYPWGQKESDTTEWLSLIHTLT